MKKFFTILGGMGTLASESFVRVLNARTTAHTDQDYLDYVLVNHATVPDRTAYILGECEDSPVEALTEDIKQHSLLRPEFFVLTCNTAHTFYDQLQQATDIPILHMPRHAAKITETRYAQADKKIKVALLATEGTVRSGVYAKEFSSDQFEFVLPNSDVQQKIMDLIYRDIKINQYLNHALYLEILADMLVTEACDVAILGCTELSLMEEKSAPHDFQVVDAQSELIDLTLKLATSSQKGRELS
ncbi:amino acid racemase [Vagococcus humatus]|uniref:Aspartate racemase n=1 Tax=Vagococcus humatus TaxID=1889241 RepID=A0A3S0GE68_9ENTE|nr:amino acid racemase [Vagococcus humatus]RST89745.1 aspartate racemase [Vagococcus humatus]